MAANPLEPQIAPRPSFSSSMLSGISGFIKGALSGGLTGIVGGAIVGAIVGGITLATGGAASLAIGAAAVAETAGVGAAIGGMLLAPLGALSGLVTGVVRNREANQPTATDIINVAKVSFSQGVQVGAHVEKQKTEFLKNYQNEKNQKILMGEQQREH